MVWSRRLGQLAAFIAIAAVFGVGSNYFFYSEALRGEQRETSGEAQIGGPFSLVNTEGERVRASDFEGGYTLVLFGYTFCPDVCPMSLIKITRAIDMLAEQAPEKAERVTPVFITVDPERDDVEAMRDYVSHFHPRMVGLTGSPSDIEEAAAAYQVVYWRVESEQTTQYTMAHTAYTFLMDPNGRLVTRFDHDVSPESVAKALTDKVSG